MTVFVQNTALTNTYDFWRNRTNELADAMSTKTITVNSNTTTGNAVVNGAFQANALHVINELRGGNNSTSSTLIITSNVSVSGTLTTTSIVANGNITFNETLTTTSIVANGNITSSGNITSNGNITANGNITSNGTLTATSITTNGNITSNGTLTTTSITANGSLGSAGQVLHSNGSGIYWAVDDQGITSITAGNGLIGGTITTSGTISVDAAYINTISSNTAQFLTGSKITTNSTVLVVNNAGLSANGTLGSAGQVLHSNGSATYWNQIAGFPSGTKMLFVQSTAPTGWTKDVTHNDKALRVVSGTTSSGGSVGFTTAFASKTVSGTVGSTTLTTTQMPVHSHGLVGGGTFLGNQLPGIALTQAGSGTFVNYNAVMSTAGSGGSHNHTFTGTAINMEVQYVDVIIATKD